MTGQPVEAYIDELLKEYDSYDISSLKRFILEVGHRVFYLQISLKNYSRI